MIAYLIRRLFLMIPTLFGELKYGPDFKHFDYINPDAPKGGKITFISFYSTFDTLHRYIILGTAPLIRIYENLMVKNDDEPVSIYCLLADKVIRKARGGK